MNTYGRIAIDLYNKIIGKRIAFELDTEFMKLLKLISCQYEMSGGNVKLLTALGEAIYKVLSDVGSIHKRSRTIE